MSEKREDYLTWDEYFMALTTLSAAKSEYSADGACLVDKNHRILSVGFRDIPLGIKKNSEENGKDFVVDSLSNVLYTFRGRRQEFEGGTLYLSFYPTYEQCRQIAQAKLNKVIYAVKPRSDEIEQRISNIILNDANVRVIPYWDDNYTKHDYSQYLIALKKVIKAYLAKGNSPFLTKDEYYMGVASLASLRSKDPSTQVGACLIDKYDRILSVGYNGASMGMSDDELPWKSSGEKDNNLIMMKDPYIIHAEMNAFDNYRGNQDDLRNAKLYLTYSPCINCTKRISIAGLERVIYLREYSKDGISKMSSRWLNRAKTIGELYNEEQEFTKEQCLEFFGKTTEIVKKYGSRNIWK